MKKILYISAFSHYKMGGQKSMLNLINNLDRSRFTPFVVLPAKGPLSDLLDEKGVAYDFYITPPLKPKNIVKIISSLLKLHKIIKSRNISIIHPDFERDALIAGLCGRIANIPSVWHVRLTRATKQDCPISRLNTKMICISEGAKERFKNSDKGVVIYNGVDCELFKPVESKADKKKELGLDGSTPLLIFVGQIKEGKGLFDIIEAINILKKENKAEFLCLFIGEEAEKEGKDKFITKIKENGLEEKIKLVGQKENIQDWMQGADILMLPSHEGVEGMGRVLFEAMACGTAVIGSDTSGVNEAVTLETGILVPEKSPKDLAKAIDKILSDDELRKGFEIEGRKRALEHFDIRVHAKKIMDLYDSLES